MAPAIPSDAVGAHGPSQAFVMPWLRISILALLIFVSSAVCLEIFWRIRGHRPTVPDSSALWAYHRSHVVGDDPNIIVAIGTSRVRADLSPVVIAECLPEYHFVQLGINGTNSPIGALTDVSSIPRFCGTVVCDLLPPLADRRRWTQDEELFRKPSAPFGNFDTYVYSLLCDRFLIVNPVVSLRPCFGAAEPRFVGAKQVHFRVHADRSLDFDEPAAEISRESKAEMARRYAKRLGNLKYKSIEDFRANVAPLADVISRIARNGGHVVFLRLPAAGALLTAEEEAFPSAPYFNALAEISGADWIDFRSLGNNQDFDCPDFSHLSTQGSQVFSRRLVDELKRRGIVLEGRLTTKSNGHDHVR